MNDNEYIKHVTYKKSVIRKIRTLLKARKYTFKEIMGLKRLK